MQEPYDEELAIYIDLELCTLIRKDWGEALTKACAGWVLSLEKILIQGADGVRLYGKQHLIHRLKRDVLKPCVVVDPMHVQKGVLLVNRKKRSLRDFQL